MPLFQGGERFPRHLPLFFFFLFCTFLFSFEPAGMSTAQNTVKQKNYRVTILNISLYALNTGDWR